MDSKKILGIIFLIFTIVFVSNCGENEKESSPAKEKTVKIEKKNTSSVQIKAIQVKKLFNTADLKPGLDEYITISNYRVFDVDKDGNIYILDFRNHRVMKYTQDGTFLLQIESIGKDGAGLFKPAGLRIHKDSLYINSYGGTDIKQFSLNGDFVSSFSIKNVRSGSHIDIYKDKIYSNVRIVKKDYNSTSLFQVYSKAGKPLKPFGKIVESHKYSGYQTFNNTFFTVRKGHLLGTFKNLPILFHYNLDGKLIHYTDLRKSGISQVTALEKDAIRNKLDTPMNIKRNDGYVENKIYCNAFDIDDRLHSYYSITPLGGPPFVFHFDENGKIVEKLILKDENNSLFVKGFSADKNSDFIYGIGISLENRNTILFKFDNK
jgi:hypothetical protein